MSSLAHTDPTFATDAPAPTTTEPPLPLVRTPRRRFPSRSRQNHSADTARERGVFVLGREKATIGCGHIRRTAEDLDVSIQRRRP
jgi:hypothetical protein